MKELNLSEVHSMISSKELSYNNFYDLDLDIGQYETIQHYLQNQNDNITKEQNLHIVYNDIECYSFHTEFDHKIAKQPINAITLYSSFEKIYHSNVFLINDLLKKYNIKDIQNFKDKIKQELIDENYLDNNEDITLNIFTDELTMIKFWANKQKQLDPAILSGYNSDGFDYPYIYKRLNILTNNEKTTADILSKFGIIKTREIKENEEAKLIIKIPEFEILDILKLYKPRDDKGLNYGKKQPIYSLEWLANKILGITKLNYKESGMGLDALYEDDIYNFIKYNIIDVILPNKMNNKLKHIEVHNLLRRDMKTNISHSVRGPSALFDTFFSYDLAKDNKKFQFGVLNETSIKIPKIDVDRIEKPKNNKINWTITNVSTKQTKSVLNKFQGAYVKKSYPKLIDMSKGISIDLDAKALYPSMLKRHNISIETFYGVVLDPLCYKTLSYISTIFGTNNKLPESFNNSIFLLIDKYIEKLDPDNKKDAKQILFFIILHLCNKLKEVNIPISKLLQPSNKNEYLILKMYLLPLLDLITTIHPNGEEYNTFAYNYIFNNKTSEEPYLYIITNINTPNIKVEQIKNEMNSITEFITKNNLILTLAGTLFYNHSIKLGMVYNFVTDRISMREEYQKLQDIAKKEKNMSDYIYYNNRQNIMKINANSTYGLMGLTSFRFSNKFLAESVTLSGRMLLKLAQISTEMYLRNINNEPVLT